jgi:glycosyltransferase involved in cell wall biosynthesis
MARINLVVPALSRDRFSGGIWCIFKYANGLASRGHDLTVVPALPSEYPAWFPDPIGRVITSASKERLGRVLRSMFRAGTSVFSGFNSFKAHIEQVTKDACRYKPWLFPTPVCAGISEAYVMEIAPEADITIATSFNTVRAAALLTGKKFYFAQHFEPYLATEFANSHYAEVVARQSYNLGFHMIANSTWLKETLRSECGDVPVSLCTNAIDHSVFYGEPKPHSLSQRAIVISYGGRNSTWKGFREMAEAVSIARKELPNCDIEWRVYGDALIKPDEITPYVSLGFLSPAQLSDEYRKADILLSASWYESFPLFPIEAMACGLPVISTQYGTEDYGIDGVTMEIVKPQSPRSVADGLIRLIQDQDYRQKIAQGGNRKAKEFCWEKSVDRFENILSNESDTSV